MTTSTFAKATLNHKNFLIKLTCDTDNLSYYLNLKEFNNILKAIPNKTILVTINKDGCGIETITIPDDV